MLGLEGNIYVDLRKLEKCVLNFDHRKTVMLEEFGWVGSFHGDDFPQAKLDLEAFDVQRVYVVGLLLLQDNLLLLEEF